MSYVNIGITIVLSLVYTPFLLRVLGQVEYGLFAIAFSAIGLFSIMDLGLGNANIRYTAKYIASGEREKERSLHGTFVIMYSCIGILALMAGLLVYSNIQSVFGRNMSLVEISMLRTMLLFVTVSVSLSFPLSVFGFIIQGYERFLFVKLIELLRIILVPAIAVILLLTGYRSVSIIAGISIVNVTLLTLNMFYCFRYLKLRLNFRDFDTRFLYEVIGYSFFVFLGVLSYQINNSSNQFILGIVSGSVQVAVYGLAFNLVINFMALSTALSSLFLPAITKIPENEKQLKTYNNYFISIGRLQFFVLALFYIGFVFFGRQFIALWAGEGYELSYYICLILITILNLFLIQTVGKSILEAKKKHQFRSILFVVMSLVNIVLSFFLSKRYGALGAALSLSVCWLIGDVIILNIFYAKKIKLDILRFWKQIGRILPAFIPAIIFGGVYIHFNNADTWIKLGLGVILLSLIYGISVMTFSFNRFEKDLIIVPIAGYLKKIIGS